MYNHIHFLRVDKVDNDGKVVDRTYMSFDKPIPINRSLGIAHFIRKVLAEPMMTAAFPFDEFMEIVNESIFDVKEMAQETISTLVKEKPKGNYLHLKLNFENKDKSELVVSNDNDTDNTLFTHITMRSQNLKTHIVFQRPVSLERCKDFQHYLNSFLNGFGCNTYTDIRVLAYDCARIFFDKTEKERGYDAYQQNTQPPGKGYVILMDMGKPAVIVGYDPFAENSEKLSEKPLISAANHDTMTSVASKVDYSGALKAKVEVELEAIATTNDIYNWIQACTNPEALKYIGHAALNAAKRIENPPDSSDYDVMR